MRYATESLGQLCNVSIGRTPRRSDLRYWGGAHPWATIRDLNDGILYETSENVTDAALNDGMPKAVAPNTLLFSFKLSIGRMAFAGRAMYHNEAIAALPIRDPKRLDREFLYWVLKAKAHDDAASHAVLGKVLNKRKVEQIEIPLPPLPEQRRIVGILNRAARIERLRGQARERLQEFIPALFIGMFGDPASNPMGWPVAPLGDVCAIVGGGTPRRSNHAYFGGPIPWATPTDVTALSSLSIQRTAETITESGLRESSARLVPAGTVLLTSRATIGFTAIARAEMATNQGFANLTCGTRLLPEYLAVWLRLRRDRLIQLAGGTTFKEISKSTLKKIEVPLPEIKRQRRFANLIGTAHATASIAREVSASAATLSASLMSRLLDNAA